MSTPSVAPGVEAIPLASANRRIVARWIDSLLLGVTGYIGLVLFWSLTIGPIPADLAENSAFGTIVGFLGMLILDAQCTKLWGRTPGKLLLGLKVESTDGAPIEWSRAWTRAVLVWYKGLCLGIPLVMLVTAAVAMRRVAKTGYASWDEETGTRVVRT
jgi:uncharacterized RDD family membrane protein YckC